MSSPYIVAINRLYSIDMPFSDPNGAFPQARKIMCTAMEWILHEQIIESEDISKHERLDQFDQISTVLSVFGEFESEWLKVNGLNEKAITYVMREYRYFRREFEHKRNLLCEYDFYLNKEGLLDAANKAKKQICDFESFKKEEHRVGMIRTFIGLGVYDINNRLKTHPELLTAILASMGITDTFMDVPITMLLDASEILGGWMVTEDLASTLSPKNQ